TLRRRRMEREMDAEFRFHREAYAEDLVRGGMAREEAVRRARLDFGAAERAKEECREARRLNIIDRFVQDFCFGARGLRKNPGFTLVAVLTLALGIGANTTLFSAVKAVLLNRLPYWRPERLVALGTVGKSSDAVSNVSYLMVEDWKQRSHSFRSIA